MYEYNIGNIMIKKIEYEFFYWGPFLYQTTLTKEEINKIKDLCSKENEDYRKNLAGIIKHEHKVDHKKLFTIIAPYIESYAKAYQKNHAKYLGDKLELITAWVNYMTKFESNPLHAHNEDLSFVLFLQIPKNLLLEYNKHLGNMKPGCLNFVHSLETNKLLISQHSFFPKIGDLFIFPSCLHHYVNHFQSDGERISVSGNIRIING